MLVDLSGAALPRKLADPVNGSALLAAYLTVEEKHTDAAVITKHPVEMGATMSDHIYLMPPELNLRLGWSNADDSSTGASYVRDVYARLLQIKNARQLFTAYTGKRLYNNMFVEEIDGPRTDAKFEYSMIVDLRLVQVLLVNLQTTGGASATSTNAAANPSAGNQADPAATQPTQSVGSVQASATTMGSDDIPVDAPKSTSPQGVKPTPPNAVSNTDNGAAGPASYFNAGILGAIN